jgi:hypothetical protein
VNTHRTAIMSKLQLHHNGQLMLYALRQGYVLVTPDAISRPGFQRRIRKLGEKGDLRKASA